MGLPGRWLRLSPLLGGLDGIAFPHDLGETFDLFSMSPALVSETVCRSVDRWRMQRIIACLPTLTHGIATTPPPSGQNHSELTILVTRPIGALLRPGGRPPSSVPQWTLACRAQLLSAATGGQWPQVRIARIAKDIDDVQCQLCRAAPGTLLHRRSCPASMPSGGWPQPPSTTQALLTSIGGARLDLLHTRGLLAIKIRRPPVQEEAAVRWIGAPPDVTRSDLIWYTDGSLKYGSCWELRRTGCSLVVVSQDGDLVAYGHAVPPAWVRSAAAAELWAVMLVLLANPAPPPIVTDCLSILTTAIGGTASAIAPSRPQAQIWDRIATILGADVSMLVDCSLLTWMPAHRSMAVIGAAMRSDGRPVSAQDWRANRLADALAKAAIGDIAACRLGISQLAVAQELVRHEAAVLGAATYAANNHVVMVLGRDGQQHRKTLRDSTALRRPPRPTPHRPATPTPSAQGTVPAVECAPTFAARAAASDTSRPRLHVRRAADRRVASQLRSLEEDRRVRDLLATGTARRPSSAPPAEQRMAALRARVAARAAAAACS